MYIAVTLTFALAWLEMLRVWAARFVEGRISKGNCFTCPNTLRCAALIKFCLQQEERDIWFMWKEIKFWSGFPQEKAYETKTVTFTNPVKPGVHKHRAPCRPGDKMLCGGAKYLWILSMKIDPYHLSGACNFEAVLRSSED